MGYLHRPFLKDVPKLHNCNCICSGGYFPVIGNRLLPENAFLSIVTIMHFLLKSKKYRRLEIPPTTLLTFKK